MNQIKTKIGAAIGIIAVFVSMLVIMSPRVAVADDLSDKEAALKKQIAENRIVVKTFGEKVPAMANELPGGEDDPEGRARNRRVEFKIIPDKADDAPEFESYGEVVKEVKTGPGFTYGKKK